MYVIRRFVGFSKTLNQAKSLQTMEEASSADQRMRWFVAAFATNNKQISMRLKKI